MSLRNGHGDGAGVPHVEIVADEAPAPVPGAPEPIERRPDGTVSGPEAARALSRLAVEKRRESARLVTGLGLSQLAGDVAFRPYQVGGDDWVTHHLVELARCGGGRVGPGPASIVQSAGIQLAASRYFADRAIKESRDEYFTLSSTLANASRQNLLAAYELAVREAKAREGSRSPADIERAMREAAKPKVKP